MGTYVENRKIKYINKDKTLMNEEKEKFLKYLNLYRKAGNFISIALNTIDQLASKKTKLGQFAPAFVNCVYYSFWSTSVILLNCFYSRGDDLSIFSFMEYIRNNYNRIFTGKFYDIYIHSDRRETKKIKFGKKEIFERLNQCENIIKENNKLLEKLDTFRNEMFAHFSEGKKNKLKNQQLNIKELQKLLSLTEEIFNNLKIPYDRAFESLKPLNSKDVLVIEHILELYEENRELIKSEHIKKLLKNEDK